MPGGLPINFTPTVAIKGLVSMIMGVLGMYYLAIGKREGDVEKMLLGAALTLGSLFIF